MKNYIKSIKQVCKECNNTFEQFFLIEIHSMQGWTATTAWSYKENIKALKHKNIKAYRKSV